MTRETSDSNLPMNFAVMAMSAVMKSAVMKSAATTSAVATRIWTASTTSIESVPEPVSGAAVRL
jgi:hypothetical protein